jgi:chemotaxis protein histidine kinase CheA
MTTKVPTPNTSTNKLVEIPDVAVRRREVIMVPVNPVTAYLRTHPESTLDEAKKAVKAAEKSEKASSKSSKAEPKEYEGLKKVEEVKAEKEAIKIAKEAEKAKAEKEVSKVDKEAEKAKAEKEVSKVDKEAEKAKAEKEAAKAAKEAEKAKAKAEKEAAKAAKEAEKAKAKADRLAARELSKAERSISKGDKRKRLEVKLLEKKASIENRESITDINTLKQLINRPAEMAEVYGPDHKKIPGFAAIYNNGKAVSVVTKDYRLLHNKQVINPILSFFEREKINYEIGKFTFVDEVRMRVQFNLIDLRVKDNSKEGLIFSIFVSNSYNSTEAYSLSAGAYRLVCSNGMMVRESVSRIKKIHQADSIEEDAVKSVQDLITSLKDSQKKFQERIRVLISEKATGSLIKKFRGSFDSAITSHVLREIGLMTYDEPNSKCWSTIEELDSRQVLAQSSWDVYNILTRYISSPMVYQKYRLVWLSKASTIFSI